MECLNEFTCSVFVDGELPESDFREVEEHLESCHSCREMAAAFQEEHRLLLHSIQEIDFAQFEHAAVPVAAAHPVRPARPKDVAKFGGILIGAAAFIQVVMSPPDNFVLPSSPVSLDWLDPSSLSGRLNWLIGSIGFISEEGVSRMTSLVNSLSVVTMYILILAGIVMLVRRSVGKSTMVATLGMLLLLVTCSPGYSMDVRNAGRDKVVTIPAGQTLDDSLFATGEAVVIDGTIAGDLIVFARQLTINGTVKGNVVAGVSSIDVPGIVEGSIIAGGQTIQMNGRVDHNVWGFGQSISIGKNASVGGDAAGFGSDTHLNGSIEHNFYGFGIVDIAGNVGRNVVFRGSTLSLLPTARITGDLTSHVPRAETVHIDPGATIGGRQIIELPKPAPNKYATFSFYFSQMLRLAASFIAGMILLLLFPALRQLNFSEVSSILKSAGIGFLAIIAMPIAALIVAVTLIGLPVALVGLALWILGLYLAKIVIANFVGRTLFSSDSVRMSTVALNLFVGLVLVFIIINLPFIGGLIHSLLVLIGFGALLMSLYGSYQAERRFGSFDR